MILAELLKMLGLRQDRLRQSQACLTPHRIAAFGARGRRKTLQSSVTA